MVLVSRSWWSLRDTAKAVEHAAHTLLLVISAAYKISRSGGPKTRVMKVLVYEAHKVFSHIKERRKMEENHRTMRISGRQRGFTGQKRTFAASSPDIRIREDCDIVEKLGQEVKILVTATSVEALRAEELKRY